MKIDRELNVSTHRVPICCLFVVIYLERWLVMLNIVRRWRTHRCSSSLMMMIVSSKQRTRTRWMCTGQPYKRDGSNIFPLHYSLFVHPRREHGEMLLLFARFNHNDHGTDRCGERRNKKKKKSTTFENKKGKERTTYSMFNSIRPEQLIKRIDKKAKREREIERRRKSNISLVHLNLIR